MQHSADCYMDLGVALHTDLVAVPHTSSLDSTTVLHTDLAVALHTDLLDLMAAEHRPLEG